METQKRPAPAPATAAGTPAQKAPPAKKIKVKVEPTPHDPNNEDKESVTSSNNEDNNGKHLPTYVPTSYLGKFSRTANGKVHKQLVSINLGQKHSTFPKDFLKTLGVNHELSDIVRVYYVQHGGARKIKEARVAKDSDFQDKIVLGITALRQLSLRIDPRLVAYKSKKNKKSTKRGSVQDVQDQEVRHVTETLGSQVAVAVAIPCN